MAVGNTVLETLFIFDTIAHLHNLLCHVEIRFQTSGLGFCWCYSIYTAHVYFHAKLSDNSIFCMNKCSEKFMSESLSHQILGPLLTGNFSKSLQDSHVVGVLFLLL